MLIRISGDVSGIKEYLESGQKKDRYFSRDDLDERVILNGNLDIVDNVIKSMSGEGERYFRMILSFKEDHIPKEILQNISNEFRNFYFKAYSDDEIHFYAEAHLPRIKSYVDKNGAIVERKPHIHVVVPKINLQTNESVDYKELDNIKYVNAFQEMINAKYGLESPKDNPRYKINETSEYIDRYKGDGFKGKGKDFKIQLLDTIMKEGIKSVDELATYLEQNNHQIKYRNYNKNNEEKYINIVSEDGGINLRDHVFKDGFLKLSSEEKQAYLNDNLLVPTAKYLIPGTTKEISLEYQKTLQEWDEIKSLEIRYTRNFSKQQLKNYYELPPEEKIQFLQECKLKQQSKYETQSLTTSQDFTGELKDAYRRIIDNYIAETGTHSRDLNEGLAGICRTETKPLTRSRRNEIARRYAGNLERGGTSQERYRVNSDSSSTGRTNPGSSTLSNNVYEFENKQVSNQFKEYIHELKADVLLELLEKTHGLNPEIYRITVAKDGSDRIGAGTRNLNNFDFLLNEMNMTSNQAKAILENALGMQEEILREEGHERRAPKYLYEEYKIWFEDFKKERSKSLLENKGEAKETKQKIKDRYQLKIDKIREDKSIFYHKKKEIIKAIRFEQTLELADANRLLQMTSSDIRKKYNLEMQQAYRTFLMRKAQEEKDEKALLELRRLRIDFERSTENLSIFYTKRYQEYKLNISHEIDKNGVIHYKVNNSTVIKDHGARVEVAKNKDEYIELSLKLAMHKMGNKLSLRGKESFRRRGVELVVKKGLNVTFLDDFSKAYHKELLDKLQSQTDALKINAEKITANQPEKLMVQGFKPTNILLNGRQQLVNTIVLYNPDKKLTYQLYSNQIHFLPGKLDVGQFVNIKQEKDTGELIVLATKEQIIRNKIKKEILQEHAIKFKNEILEKHQVAACKNEFTGTFIKRSSSNKTPWVLIKDDNGKFIKLNSKDVCTATEQYKRGDSISVVVPKTIEIEQSKFESQINLTKSEITMEDYLQPYKTTKETLIGEVIREAEFINSQGNKAYRAVIKNYETGKQESIFTDEGMAKYIGQLIKLDKSSWNKYTTTTINDIKKELIEKFGNNTRDNLSGTVTKLGLATIRGKEVYYLEIDTQDGTIRKYGEKLREQVDLHKIKPGDSIIIQTKQVETRYKVEQNIIETKNLSENLQEQINNRIKNYQNNNTLS